LQGNHSSSSKKKYVDPNVAFQFQDNFSVGTIHGANFTPANSMTAPAASETMDIADDNDNISILTSKSLAENGNLPPAPCGREQVRACSQKPGCLWVQSKPRYHCLGGRGLSLLQHKIQGSYKHWH
jgi:hypothetical protein